MRKALNELIDIRQEYNTIRLNLAILLRALFISAEEESPARRIEQIRAFRERMEGEDIIANGYNLDIKNPHVEEQVSHDPDELLADYAEQQDEIQTLRNQLQGILAEALSH